MLTITLDCTREALIRHWCQGEDQHNKASAQDKAGLPPGQHIEALRAHLAWLKHKLPQDLQDDIAEAIAMASNEGGSKP